MAENYEKEISQLEKEIQKKLHLKASRERSEIDAKSKSSSSDADEDVDTVTAILTPEFGDNFMCAAKLNCTYEDARSQPKGTKSDSGD